jgi:hypothetical protein
VKKPAPGKGRAKSLKAKPVNQLPYSDPAAAFARALQEKNPLFSGGLFSVSKDVFNGKPIPRRTRDGHSLN